MLNIVVLLVIFGGTAGAQSIVVQRMVDSVSADRLTAHIDILQKAGDHWSRANFTPGLDSAVEYVKREFISLPGISSVRRDTFFVATAQHPFNAKPMFNIVATKYGSVHPDKKIVIGAHIDACGSRMPEWSQQWSTMPVPGADDNASGVSVVLEMARILSDTAFGFSSEYTIDFVAFGVEETGPAYTGYLYGSRLYAQKAKERGETIVAMICVDMVGFNDEHLSMDIVTNEPSRWISDQIATAVQQHVSGMTVNVAAQAYTFSDHAPFWEQGFPAVCLIEGAPPNVTTPMYAANPYYHTSGDTLGQLNPQLLQASARTALATVATLLSSQTGIPRREIASLSGFKLEQNYPNPFNPSTTISYSVPENGSKNAVVLQVYDLLGRSMSTLVNEVKEAGTYSVQFHPAELPGGMYFYRLINDGKTITRKMLFVK
ncbi:MAG: M28 family peptidase [Bacteroidota bacterium]